MSSLREFGIIKFVRFPSHVESIFATPSDIISFPYGTVPNANPAHGIALVNFVQSKVRKIKSIIGGQDVF